MAKTEYNGTNIEYYTIGCVRIGNNIHICGDNLFITSMNGAPYKQHTGMDAENCIWVMNQQDEFQNIENLCMGIEFIDKYATPAVRQKCFDELMKLELQCKELDRDGVARHIAFFCEVGVWNDSKIRHKELYDKDFRKYLFNCRRIYKVAE